MSSDLKLEIMTVRVPQGTLAKIDALLKGGELRAVFIRAAVEAEIMAREESTRHDRHQAEALRIIDEVTAKARR